MHRIDYARLMLRLLGYAATEKVRWDAATRQVRWQVTAGSADQVIVARAPTQAAAWFEACRMAEALLQEDCPELDGMDVLPPQ